MNKLSQEYLENLILRYPELKDIKKDIRDSSKHIIKAFQNKRKLLICGNGGSAADCEHITGELMKGFMLPRLLSEDIKKNLKGLSEEDKNYLINNLNMSLPTISLTSQSALITAIINDQKADLIFAQQVLGYGNKGDILLAISTSGNSKNVVYASFLAKALGLTVIALTGQNESILENTADIVIKAPNVVAPFIQEYHLPIYHTICLIVENELFT